MNHHNNPTGWVARLITARRVGDRPLEWTARRWLATLGFPSLAFGDELRNPPSDPGGGGELRHHKRKCLPLAIPDVTEPAWERDQ